MITNIPTDALRESPTNPRRTIGDLSELTDSIRRVGVLQPLLARQVDGHLELVFGHRRLLAAIEAELLEVPVMIREMSDREVLEAQIIENCQRQDIDPLDEAEGYRRLHEEHGYEIDELAAKLGKSRAYIYGRMKLCALSKKARKALADEQISTSVALELARVPTAMQDQALESLLDHGDSYMAGKRRVPQQLSYRVAKEILRREFMLPLGEAPFDVADDSLLPKIGPCTTCPKRTGAQPELFADVGSPDVCTDTDCYQAKRAAGNKRRMAEHKHAGGKVLTQKRTKQVFPHRWSRSPSGDYVDAQDKPDWSTGLTQHARLSWARLLDDTVEQKIVLAEDGEGRLRELLPKQWATKELKKHRPKLFAKPERHQQIDQAEKKKRAAERKWLERARERMGKLMEQIAQMDVYDLVHTPAYWRLVVQQMLEGSWCDTIKKVVRRRGIDVPKGQRPEDVLRKELDAMGSRQLAGLLLELVCSRSLYASWGKDRERALGEAERLVG